MLRYLTYFGEKLIHSEFVAPQRGKDLLQRPRRARPAQKSGGGAR